MKNKILVYFIVGLFLLSSLFSVSIVGTSTNKTSDFENSLIFEDENDAELPIWEVGHSWTYDVTINGGIGGIVSINNVKINNLEFTVDEVSDDTYGLSYSASSVTGSVSVTVEIITISGNLQNTDMEGELVVNKSMLTNDVFENLAVDGFIKPNILPRIPFNVQGDMFLFYGTALPKFPLNNGDIWYVSEISISTYFDVNLLPDPIEELMYVEGHMAECHEWDIVNAPAGEFDALRISTGLGDEQTIWYAVSAGNFIKMRGRDIPLSYSYHGDYDIDIVLKSTNFNIPSDPPSAPSILTGPPEVAVGVPELFTAGGSVDPDGDMIRYVFDWGDGKQTGTDFVPSGDFGSYNYYWTQKGQYSVKVKARDKYGAESGWSDPITVNVLNDPPLKPDPPSGPASAKVRRPHTYSANSTDPNDHRIRFKFDWGDGKTSYSNMVESGETASATHTWTWQGTYLIKVKAIDEYGEESPWSDPLSVTMPVNQHTFSFPLLQRLLGRFPNAFPIVRYLLEI